LMLHMRHPDLSLVSNLLLSKEQSSALQFLQCAMLLLPLLLFIRHWLSLLLLLLAQHMLVLPFDNFIMSLQAP